MVNSDNRYLIKLRLQWGVFHQKRSLVIVQVIHLVVQLHVLQQIYSI